MAIVLQLEQIVESKKRGLHDESTKNYQKILELDPSNREALCIIAADQFYNNDPVQSFSYYRRSLQAGTGTSLIL